MDLKYYFDFWSENRTKNKKQIENMKYVVFQHGEHDGIIGFLNSNKRYIIMWYCRNCPDTELNPMLLINLGGKFAACT